MFVYDAMGRLTSQTDWASASVVAYSRTATYNAKNQVVSDDVSAWQGGALYRSLSTYSYGSGASYALGAATQIDTQRWKNGAASEPDTQTINSYQWWDGAVQASTTHDADTGNAYNALWVSTYNYAVIGGQAQLTHVAIVDGRPRTVMFRSDMLGQVIRRDEKDNLAGGDPHEVWYRYSGRQMGYVGNNGFINSDYAQTINQRAGSGGTPGSYADYDLATDPINAYEQGSRGGTYTVQSGDTLQAIAANLWGDSALWYKIAEVNGLVGDETLIEGQLLIIPVGVQTNQNNATTFKPYDPLEVLGNTSPTSPTPPTNKKGCGGIGQVLLAAIAIVVAAYVGPYMAKLFSGFIQGANAGVAGAIAGGTATAAQMSAATTGTWLAAGAGATVGGAAGSIVSQGVGIATGIQEKFSWNAVALSAIGSGVGVGVMKATTGAPAWMQSAAVRAAATDAITQGIGVATGLQKDFSWASVAASGIGAFVAGRVPGGQIVKRGAAALASAAARSLIEGSDFGDNIIAALPSVLALAFMPRGEAAAPSEAPPDPLALQREGVALSYLLPPGAVEPLAAAADASSVSARGDHEFNANGVRLRAGQPSFEELARYVRGEEGYTAYARSDYRLRFDYAGEGDEFVFVRSVAHADNTLSYAVGTEAGPFYPFEFSEAGSSVPELNLTITLELRPEVAIFRSIGEFARHPMTQRAMQMPGFLSMMAFEAVAPRAYENLQQIGAQAGQMWTDHIDRMVAEGRMSRRTGNDVLVGMPTAIAATGAVMGTPGMANEVGVGTRMLATAAERSVGSLSRVQIEILGPESRLGTVGGNVNVRVAPQVRFLRWRRGDAVDKPLPDGSSPSWDTVRSRYWKNRAGAADPNEFSLANRLRMRLGLAPQDFNPRTGLWESRELHHNVGQRLGGSDNPINLREVTPDQHRALDPYRR